MGVYSTALSAGSAITAVSAAPIAANFGGWRAAVGVWSLLIGMGVAIWIAVARREVGRTPASGRSLSHHALPWRNGLAWRIALYFAGTNFIFYAMVAWTAAIFTEAGVSPEQAGFLLGTFTIVFTIASAAIGWLSKSIDRRTWLASGGAACIGGALVLAMAPNSAPFVSVSTIAVGLGIAFPLAMTLPLDNTGNAQATSAWTAFVLTLGYLVAAAGPLVVGALRDLTGSFTSSMFALVAAASLMLLTSPFLKPQVKIF
jgi:CP family cyanate transporter-like MFS transporter